eukprot:418656_1
MFVIASKSKLNHREQRTGNSDTTVNICNDTMSSADRYKLLRQKAKQNDKTNQQILRSKQQKPKITTNRKKKKKKKKKSSSKSLLHVQKDPSSSHTEERYFKTGDQVALTNGSRGTVYYVGKLKGCKYPHTIYYGIALTQKKGNCNGSFKNKSYFKTSHNYGLFATKNDIKSAAYDDDDQHKDKYHGDWQNEHQLLLEFFWQILSDLIPFLDNSDCCNILNIKMGFTSSVDVSIFSKQSFVMDRYAMDIEQRLCLLNNQGHGSHQYRILNFVNYNELKDMFSKDSAHQPMDPWFDACMLSCFAYRFLRSDVILGGTRQALPVRIDQGLFQQICESKMEDDETGYDYRFKTEFNEWNETKIVEKRQFHELFDHGLHGYDRLKKFFMIPILSYCIQKWVFINCTGHTYGPQRYCWSDGTYKRTIFYTSRPIVCAWLSSECVIVVAQ